MTEPTDEASAPRRYRGRPREARQLERRQRLLDAGLELFATNGYHETSIAAVCTAAGVATVHFYEQFSSKDELLVAVFRDGVSLARHQVLDAVRTSTPDPRARITAGLAAYLHTMLDDPRRARINSVESVGVTRALESERRQVVRDYALVLREEAARALDWTDPPQRSDRYLSVVLIGGTNEAMLEWLDDPNPPAIDDLVAELADTFMALARDQWDTQGRRDRSGTDRGSGPPTANRLPTGQAAELARRPASDTTR